MRRIQDISLRYTAQLQKKQAEVREAGVWTALAFIRKTIKTKNRSRTKMKQLLLLIAFLLSSTCVLTQNLQDSVKNEIRRRVDSKINPAMAIAVLYPDESIEYYNFGTRSINSNQGIDEHTLFEIGSITKTFTASMLLHHQGEINLDESILNYLPAVDNDQLASITVSDLLNHKSGLPRLSEEFNPADWSNPFSDYSGERLTAELLTVKLDTSKQWSYSNLGYATIGRILENVTHQDLNSLFEAMFKKTGLSRSFINRYHITKDLLAEPSYLGIPFSHWDFTAESAYAGTIKSSSAELIRYLHHQKQSNPLFDPEKRVGSPYETKVGAYGEDQLFYKNGWFVFKPDERTEIITHNGGTGGFSSFLAFNKATETGVIILSNSLSSNDDIGLKIIYPEFKLKRPNKGISYELAQLVKEEKVHEIFDFYLSNKASGEYEVDVMQIYWLERFCFGQKKYGYSNELSNILIDLMPDDWEVYDLKGQNLERLNRFEAALENYKKAKLLHPGNKVLDEKIARCQIQ